MTTPATPAADAVSLHDLIMNLPRKPENMDAEPNQRLAYKVGHRDARHAAAELATARESALVAERDALQADLQRLMDKHNALHVNAHAVRVVAADLLAACKTAFDQTCSVGRPTDWHQINAAINSANDCAALAAPAVGGGGSDGKAKVTRNASRSKGRRIPDRQPRLLHGRSD